MSVISNLASFLSAPKPDAHLPSGLQGDEDLGDFASLMSSDIEDARTSLESFVNMELQDKDLSALTSSSGYSLSEVSEAFDLNSLPPDLMAMIRDFVEMETPTDENVTELMDLAEEAGPEVLAIVQQFISYKRMAVAQGSHYAQMMVHIGNADGGRPESNQTTQTTNAQPLMSQQLSSALNESIRQAKPAMAPGNLDALVSTNTARSIEAIAIDLPGQARSGSSELAPITLSRNLPVMGQELASQLADRIQYQVKHGVKEATVRLDPPELGKIELSVRTDNDRMSIVINTQNPQTRELVLQHLDRLRFDLMANHQGELEVEVGHQQGDHNKRQHQSSKGEVIANLSGEPDDGQADNQKSSGNKRWLSISV